MQFGNTLVHHTIASKYSRHNTKRIECTFKTVSDQLVTENLWNLRDWQS